MRELTDHKVNPTNDVLTVAAIGEPGSGGAHHAYLISGFDLSLIHIYEPTRPH